MCVYVECIQILNNSTDASTTANVDSGVVIAVPIPQHAALLGKEIDEAISLALQEARSITSCSTIL